MSAPPPRGWAALRTTLGLLRTALDGFVARRLGASLALMTLSASLSAFGPVIYKLLVDALTAAQASADHLALLWWVAAYVLAQGLLRVTAELRGLVHSQGMQRLTRRLSLRLFGHIVSLPLSYHLERRTGAVGETLTQGLSGCQMLLQHLLFTIFPIIIELVTIVAVLVHFNHPGYLLIFLPTALAYLLVFRHATLSVMAPSRASSSAQIASRAVLADSLLNYETVKYFTAEPLIARQYDGALARAESAWRKLITLKTTNNLWVALIFTASLGASLACAGYEVAHGTMTVGDFVLIVAYVTHLGAPLETLGYAVRDLSQGMAFLERMLEIFLEQPEIDIRDDAPRVLDGSGALRFHNVSFCYRPERTILSQVSFTAAPGSVLGIVGASGSGKSSLIRLLFRLYEVSDGEILLDDTPIRELPLATLRRAIAIVPQDVVLFNDTLGNNILFGDPQATQADVERVARLAHLDQLIAKLPEGYETRVGERGMKLSGGEQQRVAIARAALKRPKIFVFDEATSALDSHTEREILQNLREVAQGSTCLIIAHRLSSIVHADEIIVLHHARMVERGTHRELLERNGHYAALWRAQHETRSAALTKTLSAI